MIVLPPMYKICSHPLKIKQKSSWMKWIPEFLSNPMNKNLRNKILPMFLPSPHPKIPKSGTVWRKIFQKLYWKKSSRNSRISKQKLTAINKLMSKSKLLPMTLLTKIHLMMIALLSMLLMNLWSSIKGLLWWRKERRTKFWINYKVLWRE